MRELKRLTVARNHQKFVIFADVVYLDVGEGSDYLLLGREICALLELEIADGTRQGEVAIDTAEVDKTAGCLNTGLLGCKLLDVVFIATETCD